MFDIIRKIGAITREIQIDSNAQFRAIGLSNNAFIYVIRTCEQPGMFLAELADTVQIDRTTAFRTVKKLVAEGYLRLEDDAQDKRLRRVFPAQRGLDVYPQLHAYEQHSSDTLLAPLSEDERTQLWALLKRLPY